MAERRRARIAALGALLAVLAALALVALLGLRSSRDAARPGALPSGNTTATVQRRTLTEHAIVDGTLGYGETLDLYDRLPGTFTWLPSIGAVIRRGETLFKVNQQPVVLMYGPVPAYRTLKAGASDNADIKELNENLIALGYDPYGEIGDLEHYGPATIAAVKRWQAAEGLAQTGTVQLGRVIFAPGARRVTEVHVSLGQDPPGKDAAASTGAGTGGSKRPAGAAARPAGGESPTGAGTLVLSSTSTRQLVKLQVEAAEQQLAHVGATVPVTLPNGSKAPGRITAVGSVAREAGDGEHGEGGSGKATIAVTIALEHPVQHLDQAPVSVELIKESVHNVLAVPATALIAIAAGRYAIETIENGRRAQLEVTPGMFADGYVQVEGPGVHAGLTVTEPVE